jgi:hypothetical protein
LNSPAPRTATHQRTSSLEEVSILNGKTKVHPHWLLLIGEVGCLAGILYYITTIIWSPAYLTLGDVIEYHQYALAFWTQAPLFHQFPQEYPPLALVPFTFTLSPFSGIRYYWAFAFWTGIIVCLSYLWLARAASHRKALVYALYLLVGAMATLLMRYDLLPALTTLGALMLTERKRYAWAYTLLAAGVLLKLYPAFLVPVVMAAQWRDSLAERSAPSDSPKQAEQTTLWQRAQPLLKGVWLFVLIIALGFGVPIAFNAPQATSVFSYNLTRPIQLESVPASLLWLGTFIGFPAQGVISFGSLNLVGALSDPLKLLSLAGLAGGSLLVYWRVWRGRLSPGQAFLAAIGILLICNKVLSPQYFMWVLPLVAYVLGLDLLWLLICFLTTLIYPFLYHVYFHLGHEITNPVLLWTIAIRNALLVVAVLRAVQGKAAWPGLPQTALKHKTRGFAESSKTA